MNRPKPILIYIAAETATVEVVAADAAVIAVVTGVVWVDAAVAIAGGVAKLRGGYKKYL